MEIRKGEGRFESDTIRTHRSWKGTCRPDEKVLRTLRAEFKDLLTSICENEVIIKDEKSCVEIFQPGNETDAFAHFDIYRDRDEDNVIHIAGFAPQDLIEEIKCQTEKIKRMFTPYIPELKPEINLKGKAVEIKFDLKELN